MDSLGELRDGQLMQSGDHMDLRGQMKQSVVGQGIVEILARRLTNEPLLVGSV